MAGQRSARRPTRRGSASGTRRRAAKKPAPEKQYPKMLSARFRHPRDPKHICMVKLFYETKLVDFRHRTTDDDGGQSFSTMVYPWRTLRQAAAWFDEICDERRESGWVDITAGSAPRAVETLALKKRDERAAEDEFEAITAELAEALRESKGKPADERRAMDRALVRYAAVRSRVGRPRWHDAFMFFASHGTGLFAFHRPALRRACTADEEQVWRRWLRMLDTAVRSAARKERRGVRR